MNRRFLLILTLIVLVVGGIVAVGYSSRVAPVSATMPTPVPLKVGEPAPPFSVSSTAGLFDSAAVNKPIFLELFATWCPHCRREVPIINRIFAQHASELALVAVCASATGSDGESPETQADVVGFAQAFGVQYPIAFDPELEVAHKFMQSGYPTIVLITRSGKVFKLLDGEIPETTLNGDVTSLLAAR